MSTSPAVVPARKYAFADKQLFTEEMIIDRIKTLADDITRHYRPLVSERNPLVLVVVLNGAFMFAADLCRALADTKLPVRLDFICVSSYQGGTHSTGEVRMLLDLRRGIKAQHVLMVEDIVDTAQTLDFLVKLFMTRSPASLKMVALLDKKSARKVPLRVDFVCFDCPPEFVIGYGLDYQECYRELRDIVVLNPSMYLEPKVSSKL
jgi:hypoxanthine phosphoribosyltransferase